MSESRDPAIGDAAQLVLISNTRQTNWRRANPLKYRAHLGVHKALSGGQLVRQCCEVCGAETVDANHDRYDEPLNVRWLCRRHHVIPETPSPET